MLKGVLYAVLACLVWGLVFVIPGQIVGYSALEIALGRYCMQGLLSLSLFLVAGYRKFSHVPAKLWVMAALVGLIGNCLYYVTLIVGMQLTTAPLGVLIVGISPVTISLIGNWYQKECSYRKLIIPTLLMLVGLFVVNLSDLLALESTQKFDLVKYSWGLGSCFFALGAWTWYAILNGSLVKRYSEVSASTWATAVGMMTLVWVVLGIAAVHFWHPNIDFTTRFFTWSASVQNFWLGSAILGMVSGWLGFYLWSRASAYLPLTLAGQLLVLEMVFGLLFVYLWEGRLPTFLEGVGIPFVITSVFLTLQAFKKPSTLPSELQS